MTDNLQIPTSKSTGVPAYAKILIGIGIAIVVLLFVITFSVLTHNAAMSSSSPTAQSNQTSTTPSEQSSHAPDDSDTTSAGAETNALTTIPPDHYYVYAEKDGTYGYAQQLSQDDINSGTAEKELVMIKYIGEKNGVYQAIETGPDGAELLFSCSKSCQFITAQAIVNGQVINKEVVPAAGTLGSEVMTDAINGKLKVYKHGQ